MAADDDVGGRVEAALAGAAARDATVRVVVDWARSGSRTLSWRSSGPAVAALERSFLDAWTAAGGAPP